MNAPMPWLLTVSWSGLVANFTVTLGNIVVGGILALMLKVFQMPSAAQAAPSVETAESQPSYEMPAQAAVQY